MDFTSLLSGATIGTILGAAVTAFATLRVAARQIRIDNVTKERTKWRSRLRKLATRLSDAVEHGNLPSIRRITHDIQLRLNPCDPKDQEIVEVLRKLSAAASEEQAALLEEVIARLALLLKHDWERAKVETRFWAARKAERIPYISSTTTPAPQATGEAKKSKTLLWLALMTGSASVIFILGASLSKPVAEAVIFFNDLKHHPTSSQWAFAILLAIGVGAVWSLLYLAFKVSEKVLVDEAMRSMK
jgi:hypothetical protein